MKVLHVLDTSLPDISGYTTRARYLMSNQKGRGVTPVALTSERLRSYSGRSTEVVDGILHYRTPPSRKKFLRRLPFLSIWDEIRTLRRRLAEVVSEERPDILHAHSPSLTGAACKRVSESSSVPLIYEIRAFWEDAAVDRGAFAEGSPRYLLRRWHETRIAHAADAIIVISGGLENDLRERGVAPEKIRIVRNGVDTERFRPVSPDRELCARLGCSDRTVFGFIGTFFHFEGLEDLLRAMAVVSEDNDDAVLLLVGSGPTDEELRNLRDSLGIGERVIFTGHVPHDQVLNYYSIMDVLVYPRVSRRITELVTPLKPLEAMAMSKAVVMSDVGGLRELAGTEKTALFFEPGAVEDLARTCAALCNDVRCREALGAKARRHVVDHWDWGERSRRTVEIYRSLLDETDSPTRSLSGDHNSVS